MANEVERLVVCEVLGRAMLEVEPRGGSDWRSGLDIRGMQVTDAMSLFDHLQKMGYVPKELQTMIDLFFIKSLVENLVVKMKWVPTTHMRAAFLTKEMPVSDVRKLFMDGGWCASRHTVEDAEHEEH